MEVVAVIGNIANFAGIISLAIQLAEVIEKAIDNAKTADERVQHVAFELRATANALNTLQTVLSEDLKSSDDDRLFTDDNRRNISLIFEQCNPIFGKMAVSFARMGRVIVLDVVDEHQRMIQSGNIAVIPQNTLTFEFSVAGRLMWQFKSRKIL